MTKNPLSGKIQTVTGIIEPQDLGVTLPHEHLISDGSAWYKPPVAATELAMAQAKVSLETLWWVRYHWFQNLDDLMLLDEAETIEEITHFQRAGGHSVIEMSNNGLGRDPLALQRVSRATGLNIIMGSGYYLADSLPAGFEKRSAEDIAEEIVRDINEGAGKTGVKAGYIGEIGCSWPLDPRERTSLIAAAKAQRITGAYLNIHPGQGEDSAFEAVAILEENGADLSRTTLDHIDRAVRDPQNRLKLARKGLTLEYDLFGREGYYPPTRRMIDLPTDHQRLNEIMDLIQAGFLNQILMSSDIWNKHQRRRYGGWGYDHILRNTLPVMRLKGFTQEMIDAIMIHNPARLLTFK